MLSCRALAATVSLKVWLVICAVAIAVQLGGPALIDSDEGRNAEVAREMAETNDYVVPRLNTLPYLDKPIVYFAAQAAFMEVLGPGELAARLPAYLFTLATAALIFWFSRRRIGEEEAWVSTIAYLAMPLTIAFARTVIFDSTLTFFVVLATLAFYEAIETQDRRWTVLAWAAMAAGVLTKGPVAIALPLLAALPYALWRRSARTLWSLAGLLAFLAIVAPWIWAVSRVVPDFLHYALVTETAARFTSEEFQRSGPPWYYVPYVLAGAGPWAVAVIAGWRQWDRSDRRVVFLLTWVLVPLIFFSVSESKRSQYILPLMPAIAMLVGLSWRNLRYRAGAMVLLVAGLIFAIGPFLRPFTKIAPDLVGPARLAAWAFGVAFIGGAVAALLSRSRKLALFALSLPMVAIPLLAGPLLHAVAERRSAKSLVAAFEKHITPETEVIGVEAYTGSMGFYLGRPLIIATDDASELTSNYILRRYGRFAGRPGSPVKPVSWFMQNLERCCDLRVYVVRDDDPHHHRLLESRGARLLVAGTHYFAYAYAGPPRP